MPPLSRREFTAWNGLTFNLVTILQAHDAAIRALTLNHAGTYIASAGQSGIVKYFKTNMNNLTAWRAQRGPFSRQIMHDLQLPVMTLRWGSGLSRRVERSASLPATDGTSNASSGTQQWASVSVAAVRFGPVQGYISPNPEPDRRSGSGKSPNPNLNLRERFFRSGSGSHPLRTRTGLKEPLGLSSQTFVNRTRTKVEIEEMQT